MSAIASAPLQQLDLLSRAGAVVTTIVLIVLLTFVPIASNDFWLQAKIGEMILEDGSIPHTVLFPFTWAQSNVFNAHEWLPSIVFHAADRGLGHERLLLAQGAAGIILFGLSLWLAVRLARSLAIGLLMAASAMIVANYRFHLRPELFALAYFLLLLLVLTSYRAGKDWRTLAWSVPIAVLWANCHGSFIVGPVLVSIFACGEAAESYRRNDRKAPGRLKQAMRTGAPYVTTALLMALVSLANPLGLGLLHFALTLSTSEVTTAFIEEWQPTLTPSFMNRLPFRLFVASLVMTSGLVVAFRKRVTVTDLLLLTAFGFLSFQRTRYIVFFGYVALFVCAGLVGSAKWPMRIERRLLFMTSTLAGLGVALSLHFGNVWGAFPYMAPSSNFTEPMIDRLSRADMRGNVYNSYELGAELIYRAYPRLRPSIDSRIDSYTDRYFLIQEQMLYDEPLLQEFIADFDVRYMLLLWRDFEILKKMKGLQLQWSMDFADHKMVLLSRRNAGPAATSAPLLPASGQATNPGANHSGKGS